MALSDNSEFLTENKRNVETFNSFFETFTNSLNLFSWFSKVNVSDDKFQGHTQFFKST